MQGDKDNSREKPEELFREYLSRSESGEEVTQDEYLTKYPELEADLKKLFSTLKAESTEKVDLGKSPIPSGGAGPAKEQKTLGDFKIIREIGSGGMATVYEAHQISLNRKVALKVLPSHLSFSDQAVRKFQREAEAGGRQSHSGIVSILAVGEQEGVHYIAQELVGGGLSLSNRLKELRENGDLPAGYFREAAELTVEVSDALHHAHDSGVIHRDIKPSNILITKDGRPKVSDFGLAKVEDALAHR